MPNLWVTIYYNTFLNLKKKKESSLVLDSLLGIEIIKILFF